MIDLPEATVHYSKCSWAYTKEQMLSYGKQCAAKAIKNSQDNSGCTRSHPHEDMSVECALKAEIAGLKAELRRVNIEWDLDHAELQKVRRILYE